LPTPGPFWALLRDGRFQQQFHRIDLLALERAQLAGQPARQFVEQVAIVQDAGQRRQVLERARRADLHGKPAPRLVVADHRRHRFTGAQDGAIVQRAGALFRLDRVVGVQRAIDIGAQCLGLGGYQIAPDPRPERLERDARDAPGTLVIGRIVDDERLDRRKEQPRNLAHARCGRWWRSRRDGAAQFLENELVAGRHFAGQDAGVRVRRPAWPAPQASASYELLL
jgi:hypothetical protein